MSDEVIKIEETEEKKTIVKILVEMDNSCRSTSKLR